MPETETTGQQQWGMLDTQDNLWMGDESGPKLYDNPILAKVACTVLCIQFGWDGARLQVAAYVSHGAKRDEITSEMDGHEAFEIACGTRKPRRSAPPRTSP